MTATESQTLLGKCREQGCDYAIFGTTSDVQAAENFRDVQGGAGIFRVGNNGFFSRCMDRHRVFPVKRVKGTYSPDHKCDARCLNAKGWECTCSCGGANHGRGHAATVVAASEASAPVKTGRHLGEIGKYIRGDVRIARVLPIQDGKRVLYKFITEAGDNIDWFVPAEYDPMWAEGHELTIRAKVRTHESHGRFGNSTVVVYVEEVG